MAESDACPECGCPETVPLESRHRRIQIAGRPVGMLFTRRQCANCDATFSASTRLETTDAKTIPKSARSRIV
jgi:transcriptional regulator NrdR family protein